jgi:hypothetical protein
VKTTLSRLTAVPFAACALALLFVLATCSQSDKAKDLGPQDTWRPDILCKRPPTLASCLAPGEGCSKDVKCLGCNCSGMFPVAACDPQTGDCRWFCDGCYPMTHTLCDKNASYTLMGLCGFCLFNEAGPPKECNRYPDGGGKFTEASTGLDSSKGH